MYKDLALFFDIFRYYLTASDKRFRCVNLQLGAYLLVALCQRRTLAQYLRCDSPLPDPSADARRSWAALALAAGCRVPMVVGRRLPTTDCRLPVLVPVPVSVPVPVPNAVIKSVELWPRWLPAK